MGEAGQPDCPLCSRNARPKKGETGQPDRPPARGTRTMRLCSFDARIRGSTRPPLEGRRKRTEGNQPGPHRLARPAYLARLASKKLCAQ